MPTVKDIENYMEMRLPKALSLPDDTDGTSLCPDANAEVRRAVVALDVTLESIEYARRVGAQLLVTHHPCIHGALGAVTDATGTGKRLLAAARANIALMAYHTRLDAADGGVNDCLCEALGFASCEKREGFLGRAVRLPSPVDYGTFRKTVCEKLGAKCVTGMDARRPVQNVAVSSGSGKGAFCDAVATGADTYVTGELTHHVLLDAYELGINAVCAGHYRTEIPVLPALRRILNEGFPEVEALCFYDAKF